MFRILLINRPVLVLKVFLNVPTQVRIENRYDLLPNFCVHYSWVIVGNFLTKPNPKFTEYDYILEKSFIDPFLVFVSLAPQFLSVNNRVSCGLPASVTTFTTARPDECINQIIRKKKGMGNKSTTEDIEANTVGYPFSDLYGWILSVRINSTYVTSEFLLALMRISPLIFRNFKIYSGEQNSISSVSVIKIHMFLINPHCCNFLSLVKEDDQEDVPAQWFQSNSISQTPPEDNSRNFGKVSGIHYYLSESQTRNEEAGWKTFNGETENKSKSLFDKYEKLIYRNCQVSGIANFGNVISTSVVKGHTTRSHDGTNNTVLEFVPSQPSVGLTEKSNDVVTVFIQRYKDKFNVLFKTLKITGNWEATNEVGNWGPVNTVGIQTKHLTINLHYQLDNDGIVDANLIHMIHKHGLVDEFSYCNFFIAKKRERPYNLVLNFVLYFFDWSGSNNVVDRPVFVLTRLYSDIELVTRGTFDIPPISDSLTTLTTTTTTTTTTTNTKKTPSINSSSTSSTEVAPVGSGDKKWKYPFGFLNNFWSGSKSGTLPESTVPVDTEEMENSEYPQEPLKKKRKLDHFKASDDLSLLF